MSKPSSQRLEASRFLHRQGKGYTMGPNKRVSLVATLTVMTAAGVLYAADKGKQLYHLRYGDQRKKVDATAGKADDVALAREHLKDVEKYSDTPELVKVVLEQAFELGMRDVTGYPTAAGAIEMLIAKFPDEKADYVDSAVRIYELLLHGSQGKEAAGEKLIAILLEQAAAQAGKDEFRKSVDLASKAFNIASKIKSPRKVEVGAIRTYYRARRDLKIKPSNNALRMAVIRMCVAEMDDPAGAARLLTGDMPEELRTYVPLAAKTPAEVEEAACLELGNWYLELAKGASPSGKAICLERAIMYLAQFLELHRAEDTSRTQGSLLLDKARAELEQLQMAAKKVAKSAPEKPGEWHGTKVLAEVKVTGSRFEVVPLREGVKGYRDRDYKWVRIPRELHGWSFTRKGGKATPTIVVNVVRTGNVAVAVSSPGREALLKAGWRDAKLSWDSTTHGKENRHFVLYKRFVTGSKVTLPHVGFAGTVALIPPEK